MRFQLIDPLRGLAALWVFLFHYRFSEDFQTAVPWLHSILKLGDRGVPMFFVISGFCLAASAASSRSRSEAPGQFLKRRAVRIFPTFWLSIVFIVAVHFLLVAFLHLQGAEIPAMLQNRFQNYDWGDYLGIVTLTQIFDTESGLWFMRFGKICGAYWTLAIEFQFYLVMTVALIRAKSFITIVTCVTAASLPVYLHPGLFLKVANTGLFLPYWVMFALGILLFELLKRDVTPTRFFGRFTKVATSTLIIALALSVTVTVICGYKTERLLFAAIFTLALWLAYPWNQVWTEHLESSRGNLSRGLALLGAMSYSLYLLHMQIFWTLRHLRYQFGIGEGILLDLVIIVTTCIACYPFYRYCELPFVKLGASKKSAAFAHAEKELTVANPDPAPQIIPLPEPVRPTPTSEALPRRVA